jgi:hypothetical protein
MNWKKEGNREMIDISRVVDPEGCLKAAVSMNRLFPDHVLVCSITNGT